MLQNTLQNIHYAARMLHKSLGLTATVALTLALGIGATTAIYTVVYATLLAPLPFPKPDQLVMVWSGNQGSRSGASTSDYLNWKRNSTAFQDLNAFSRTAFNLAGKDAPEMVDAQSTTPGMFSMLGNEFQLGRSFLSEEGVDGKDHVVILTNKMWRRMGADPNITGKQIVLDQKPYTVVGVFSQGQADRLNYDLAVPLVFKPEQLNRDFRWLDVMGRLKPSVTLQQAQADMTAVATHIAEVNPRSNKGWGATVEPLKNDFLGDNTKLTLWLLLGAVGFVLLIACVNVANLLLAKGVTRQKEVAIRAALGATRHDVFAQFITESLMLAVIGGILGVGFGYAMLRGFILAMPQGTLPSEADLRLNLPVLFVTLAATTFAGLLFGCAPAWYAAHVDPAESLKEGGRSSSSRMSHRLHKLLIVGEFTAALALLTGAGLSIHSFWNLNRVDLGVQTDHVLTFSLPMLKDQSLDSDQLIGHYQTVLRGIASVTGVQSVAAVAGLPLEGAGFTMPFLIAGQAANPDPSQRARAGFEMITPDYFKTFGIRVVNGRAFTERDIAASPRVAMINEKFVRQFFPGKNPIGQRLMVEQLIPGVTKFGPTQAWEIVGVFHDVRGGSFRGQRAEIDIPFFQIPWINASIGVRTLGDPAAMARPIAAAVHRVDPAVALQHVRTMDQVRDEDLSVDHFTLLLHICFAVIALSLAVVGIYGVMAFSVGQRSQEIGVRMALGASRERVVWMILQESLLLACVGLVLGFGASFLVGRAMHSTLYGVGAVDLPAFCAGGLLLLLSALIACYFPARHASRVEPMIALKTE